MSHKIKLQKTATLQQRYLKMKNVHETVPFPSPFSVEECCTKHFDRFLIVEHLKNFHVKCKEHCILFYVLVLV